MYCKKSESVVVDALLILLFIPFFLKKKPCKNVRARRWKNQPACLEYKFLSQLYPGALQACVKAITGSWFVFSFPFSGKRMLQVWCNSSF